MLPKPHKQPFPPKAERLSAFNRFRHQMPTQARTADRQIRFSGGNKRKRDYHEKLNQIGSRLPDWHVRSDRQCDDRRQKHRRSRQIISRPDDNIRNTNTRKRLKMKELIKLAAASLIGMSGLAAGATHIADNMRTAIKK